MKYNKEFVKNMIPQIIAHNHGRITTIKIYNADIFSYSHIEIIILYT